MNHGLVLGGIGLDFLAIQRHMAKGHHSSFLTQAQDLNEQILEGIEVEMPEVPDAAVVRLVVGGEHPEGQVLVAVTLDIARGNEANLVGVDQEHRHHPRIKAPLTAGSLA
jgi:hypothetical protein